MKEAIITFNMKHILALFSIIILCMFFSCDIREGGTLFYAENDTCDTICVYVSENEDVLPFDQGMTCVELWKLSEMIPGQISMMFAMDKDGFFKIYSLKKEKLSGRGRRDSLFVSDFNIIQKVTFKDLQQNNYFVSIRE